MCECLNKIPAESWHAVFEKLDEGNRDFHVVASTGKQAALLEIGRLQKAAKGFDRVDGILNRIIRILMDRGSSFGVPGNHPGDAADWVDALVERASSLQKELDATRGRSIGWEATAQRRLIERNAQVDRAAVAETDLQRELEKHTETLKLLEVERIERAGVEGALAAERERASTGTCVATNRHRANMERIRDNLGSESGKQVAQAILYLLGRIDG